MYMITHILEKIYLTSNHTRSSIPNCFVYWETGRYPSVTLIILIKIRIITNNSIVLNFKLARDCKLAIFINAFLKFLCSQSWIYMTEIYLTHVVFLMSVLKKLSISLAKDWFKRVESSPKCLNPRVLKKSFGS